MKRTRTHLSTCAVAVGQIQAGSALVVRGDGTAVV